MLDRLYVSDAQYTTIRVCSRQKRLQAIGAYAENQPVRSKLTVKKTFRSITLNQHAAFLQYKYIGEIPTGSPQRGRKIHMVWEKIVTLSK